MYVDFIRICRKNVSRIMIAAVSFMILSCIGCAGSGGSNSMLGLMGLGNQVKKPVFSPTGGTYSTDMSVTITCATDGASIYYTTNGDEPTNSSTEYFAPVPVAGNGTIRTIKAIAVLEDMDDSKVASATYTIDYEKVSSPQFSLTAGPYNHDLNVNITCSTDGATIYYTTNGDDPSAGSTEFTGAISVSGDGADVTIKAIALKAGMEDSTIESSRYQIEYAHVAMPTFSLTQGIYNYDLSIELSCTESGADIYYTTNGDDPTTSSALYSSGIPVAGHGTVTTIKAIAVKTGMADSTIASATYTISYNQVSTPQFSIPAATYTYNINVTITCPTGGVTIYYTTNGDDPDPATSAVYSTAIPVTGPNTTMTIKALAVKTGMLNSTVASADYVIQWPTVATPSVYCTNSSSYTYIFKSETVTISTTTTGATIYYTTNGDDPTTGSTQYTAPISTVGLGTPVTVKAIAVKSAMVDSVIGQKTFTVDTRDVHIAGLYGYTVGSELYQYAGYWKNGGNYIQVRDMSSYPAGDPKRIFVSGSTTYICGSKSGQAWVWVTGSPSGTYIFSLTGNYAYGMYVSGSTVYTTGSYLLSGNTTACYWVGQTRNPITTAYKSQGKAITLSGTDVYVAGWNQASSSDPIKACYWLNGTFNDLPVPAGTTTSEATNIVISGTDIYISGRYINANIESTCYWHNGTRVDLETATDSVITGLAISGTDVYTSGRIADAGYWLNTSWIDLNYGLAVDIAVFGSDVYVLESHYTNWSYGIHITKNGTVVREISGEYHTPISMFVME